MNLSNKVAVITGATSGIGLATAKQFLAQGAKVVLTGRSQEKLDAVHNHFGKIDVLFLNAGVFRMEPVADLTEDDYDEVMNVNVKGPLFTVKAATPFLN